MFRMPGVGIGVMLLNEKNEVLLLLRNEDPAKAQSDMHLEGTWTLPAGKVKYGETLLEAAKRKVKEETNLNCDKLEIISIADDKNGDAHFVTIGFLANEFTGKIFLGDTEEQVAFGFFSLESLPTNLCDPSKIILENYLEKTIYQGSSRKKIRKEEKK